MIVSAGGTGGHIIPGIAVYRILRNTFRREEIKFICRDIDVEKYPVLREIKSDLIKLHIIPLKLINILKAMILMIYSLFYVLNILIKKRPKLIIGMGGYVTFPVILTAIILRTPFILFEPNSIPGKANKLFAHFTEHVIMQFEYTRNILKKGHVLGIPVREKIGIITKKSGYKHFGLESKKKTILVIGGSQGASSINSTILKIRKAINRYNLIWITGMKEYDKYKEYSSKNTIIRPFIKNIWYAYGASDLIISRAGAMTVSEIIKIEKPAIMIPFPYATENHQELNAGELVKKGAGMMLVEEQFSEKLLINKISKIMNKKVYKKISDKLKTINSEYSNQKIKEYILEVIAA